MLATEPGKEAYIRPVVEDGGYRFTVKMGKSADLDAARAGTKLARGAHFQCLMSGTPIAGDYIKAEGKSGRIGARMMAIVAHSDRGLVYLPPTPAAEECARSANPARGSDGVLAEDPRAFTPILYGFARWHDLLTDRQCVVLATLSDLVLEARERVLADAVAAGPTSSKGGSGSGGAAAGDHADAVSVYLGFVVSRIADRHSSICRWDPNPSGYAPKISNTFGRQAIPIVWDFAEGNPFSPSPGNLLDALGWVLKVMSTSLPANPAGAALQLDASLQAISHGRVVSTDPPYYDNVVLRSIRLLLSMAAQVFGFRFHGSVRHGVCPQGG